MHRRTFLVSASALMALPLAARAAQFVDYEPGVIDAALNDGRTVLVDYSADWCSTCKRQERVINALRAENPSYDQAMTFVRVDWDVYRSHAVTKERNVPRRSTLLLLRGDQELGRLIAGTSENQIKALLDLGV